MKNIRAILADATKYPAAIEAKLPEGAPKISTMLLDAASKIPAEIPDLPIDVPALPAPPELPALPTPPGGTELRRYVTGVTVTPVERLPAPTPAIAPTSPPVTPLQQAYTQPIEGVVGTVQVRRGM